MSEHKQENRYYEEIIDELMNVDEISDSQLIAYLLKFDNMHEKNLITSHETLVLNILVGFVHFKWKYKKEKNTEQEKKP